MQSEERNAPEGFHHNQQFHKCSRLGTDRAFPNVHGIGEANCMKLNWEKFSF
jgi:hypothetical protein